MALREAEETAKYEQGDDSTAVRDLPATVKSKSLSGEVRSGPMTVLVGDIGATHSRLASYGLRPDGIELLRKQSYPSSERGSLTEVLATFLEGEREAIQAVCLGLPGPIQSGVVFPLTNLGWRVDREEVLRTVGTDRVVLINDVEASAAGIEGLSSEELICLQAGGADPSGNRVVLSVGTGLGVSALTPTGHTFATEAGHATFSPSKAPDFELQDELQREYGHVSWERVASGSALPRIHALITAGASPRLEGPEIVRRCPTDPNCRKAVETFQRYVGAAAGNIALTLMATGGLYLCGGVSAELFDKDGAAPFLDAFRAKGRMRPLLERVPVFVVRGNDLALRGALRKATSLLERGWAGP